MPARQDDDLAWRADRGGSTSAAASPSRSLALGTAVALAVVATIVAFLAADLTLLRGAVVVAAWAVVAAAYVAVRETARSRAAADRERELRRLHDRELDLEAADRREHELALEVDVRREADEAVREEMGRLRGLTAELTRLREQLARVSGLGDSLAGLARLREDVAALGALRGDVAALSRLHDDVGQLGDLRDELAALRAELTEKIDAEMLVERILLRTRGSRTPDRPAPAEEPGSTGPDPLGWGDEPAHELTAGWPAVRLDQPPATREYETVGRYDTGRAYDALSDPLPEPTRYDAPRHDAPRHGSTAYEPDRYRPDAWRDDLRDEDASPSPLEWLADHSLLHPIDQPWTSPTAAVPVTGAPAPGTAGAGQDVPSTGPVTAQGARPVPFRRRRDDEAGGPPTDPGQAATTEHPAHRAVQRPPLPSYGSSAPPPQPDTAGHSRLSEILAEGGSPSGRRRRRYREDDETDDVLSRVLRGE